jgi:hypothetical protein
MKFMVLAVCLLAGSIHAKPKKKRGLPCRVEYKNLRMRQMQLEMELARYDSCIEGRVQPSNEFDQ